MNFLHSTKQTGQVFGLQTNSMQKPSADDEVITAADKELRDQYESIFSDAAIATEPQVVDELVQRLRSLVLRRGLPVESAVCVNRSLLLTIL